jgi:hypothetical protein
MASLKLLFAAAVIAAAAPSPVIAQGAAQPPAAAAAAPQTPNNYADARNWLCRPGGTAEGAASVEGGGVKDACASDMATTIVAADGTLKPEPFSADANAPIDCFYVYPTVSTDTTPNSDMTANPAELTVVRQQFARFASKCRPFAPLYRQVTLAGLRTVLGSGNVAAALASGVQYNDVRDAWRHYLQNDNRGRGVVLVGHSQGSFILMELIRQEIDGKPVQKQLVSAILMGTTLPVPKGKDVGGVFKNIPVCRTPSQTGCVITFASFRSTSVPQANTMFGRITEPGFEAACTNPANLAAGGSGQLRAYLSASGQTITAPQKPKPWVMPDQAIATPFVSVPGLLTARCVSNEHANYLEVTVNGNPQDPRADDITGDLQLPGWGLHLIDVNLVMGNLLDIVTQQTKAFRSR